MSASKPSMDHHLWTKQFTAWLNSFLAKINKNGGKNNCNLCAFSLDDILSNGIPKTGIQAVARKKTDLFLQPHFNEDDNELFRSITHDPRLIERCKLKSANSDFSYIDFTDDKASGNEVIVIEYEDDSIEKLKLKRSNTKELFEELRLLAKRQGNDSWNRENTHLENRNTAYGFLVLTYANEPKRLGHICNFVVAPTSNVFIIDAQNNKIYKDLNDIEKEGFRPEIYYCATLPPEGFCVKLESKSLSEEIKVKQEIQGNDSEIPELETFSSYTAYPSSASGASFGASGSSSSFGSMSVAMGNQQEILDLISTRSFKEEADFKTLESLVQNKEDLNFYLDTAKHTPLTLAILKKRDDETMLRLFQRLVYLGARVTKPYKEFPESFLATFKALSVPGNVLKFLQDTAIQEANQILKTCNQPPIANEAEKLCFLGNGRELKEYFDKNNVSASSIAIKMRIMMLVCIGGNLEAVNFVLSCGSDLVTMFNDDLQRTSIPLAIAASGHIGIIEKYLKRFGPPTKVTLKARYRLYQYLINFKYTDILKHMLHIIAPMRGAPLLGTHFADAIVADSLPMIQFLLGNFPDLLYIKNENGVTSLMVASAYGNINAVQMLLAADKNGKLLTSTTEWSTISDPSNSDKLSSNALHYAIHGGCLALVVKYIEQFDTYDHFLLNSIKAAPVILHLIRFRTKDDFETFKYLIEKHGLPLTVLNGKGGTLLMSLFKEKTTVEELTIIKQVVLYILEKDPTQILITCEQNSLAVIHCFIASIKHDPAIFKSPIFKEMLVVLFEGVFHANGMSARPTVLQLEQKKSMESKMALEEGSLPFLENSDFFDFYANLKRNLKFETNKRIRLEQELNHLTSTQPKTSTELESKGIIESKSAKEAVLSTGEDKTVFEETKQVEENILVKQKLILEYIKTKNQSSLELVVSEMIEKDKNALNFTTPDNIALLQFVLTQHPDGWGLEFLLKKGAKVIRTYLPNSPSLLEFARRNKLSEQILKLLQDYAIQEIKEFTSKPDYSKYQGVCLECIKAGQINYQDAEKLVGIGTLFFAAVTLGDEGLMQFTLAKVLPYAGIAEPISDPMKFLVLHNHFKTLEFFIEKYPRMFTAKYRKSLEADNRITFYFTSLLDFLFNFSIENGNYEAFKFLYSFAKKNKYAWSVQLSPLVKAVRCNQLVILKYILERDPNELYQITSGSKRNNVLIEAVEYGYLEIVKVLLSMDSDLLNYHNADKINPIMMAAHLGHAEILDCLMIVGKDQRLLLSFNHGKNVLQHAIIYNGHLNCVKLILEKYDTNKKLLTSRSMKYSNALLFAFAEKKYFVVKYLMDRYKFNLDEPNLKGYNILSILFVLDGGGIPSDKITEMLQNIEKLVEFIISVNPKLIASKTVAGFYTFIDFPYYHTPQGERILGLLFKMALSLNQQDLRAVEKENCSRTLLLSVVEQEKQKKLQQLEEDFLTITKLKEELKAEMEKNSELAKKIQFTYKLLQDKSAKELEDTEMTPVSNGSAAASMASSPQPLLLTHVRRKADTAELDTSGQGSAKRAKLETADKPYLGSAASSTGSTMSNTDSGVSKSSLSLH